MEIATIKAVLDACYQAQRIRAMLPTLPDGVTPSYIHFFDLIETMEQKGMRVKVSDISDRLGIPRPGVTRTVKEMEAKGYLQKFSSAIRPLPIRRKGNGYDSTALEGDFCSATALRMAASVE